MAGKGVLWPSELHTSHDPSTGRVVHQVTDYSSINHPTYFLQSSFFPDGRGLVFTSYRTGSAQLFRADWPSGQILQMTDGPPIHAFSPAIAHNGRMVYFIRGGSLWVIDPESLAETLVIEFADAQLGECSISSNGQHLVAAIKQGSQQGVVTGNTNGSGWHLIPFSRTVIHPQFHPFDPDWILFAGDPAPRMFRVRRDGTQLACLHGHSNDEFIVHETFLGNTGDIVYTVWPHQLNRLSWQTGAITRIADFNAWHISSNRAGTKVLCDTNHPDRGICMVDVATGAVENVCQSLSSNRGSQWEKSRYAVAEDFMAARKSQEAGALSWMETASDTVYGPQWTHPHPSFSHDEKLVAFASDRTGNTQVYVVELG